MLFIAVDEETVGALNATEAPAGDSLVAIFELAFLTFLSRSFRLRASSSRFGWERQTGHKWRIDYGAHNGSDHEKHLPTSQAVFLLLYKAKAALASSIEECSPFCTWSPRTSCTNFFSDLGRSRQNSLHLDVSRIKSRGCSIKRASKSFFSAWPTTILFANRALMSAYIEPTGKNFRRKPAAWHHRYTWHCTKEIAFECFPNNFCFVIPVV